ncbi:cytochrome P450 9e2-like [Sitodiplosis mosellana]|uniref:cytochrome P450 9e2-like n=1 Tax=Sitodiplosis mosellana TaxID=263140 RepID=UPI0024445F30|nr:cytochrome P450 9e2-like [Sitodiplosis mosellana]
MDKLSTFESFALISIVVLLIWHLFYNFFKTWCTLWGTNIKCDYGIPPFGTHWREIFNIESWHNTLKRLYYAYPNDRFIVLHEIGGRPQYLIRDPALVRQIAIRDFSSFVNRIGEINASTDTVLGHELTNLKTNDWRRIRNLLTPLLSGQKLKQVVIPSLNENKKDLCTFLTEQLETSGKNESIVVDMMDISTRSGVDGFCLTAFGLKTDSLRSNGNDYGFFKSAKSFLEHSDSTSSAMYHLIVHFPRVMKHLFGKTLMTTADQNFFTKSCIDIADNRIANKIQRSDYIQLLQILRDSGDNTTNNYDDDELVSQCFEFYESVITENNLITTFVMQKLAEHPEIQERLYDEMVEIESRLDGNGLSYDGLIAMKYTEMVINEAFRMCEIAPLLKRRATRSYILENGNGEKVKIQPGDAVWLPTYILQNDPQYYPNSKVFDPERYSDENRKAHVAGTYAPFGIGPRNCVGCFYPMAELKLTLYHLLVHFTIECVANHEGNNNSIKLKRRT